MCRAVCVAPSATEQERKLVQKGLGTAPVCPGLRNCGRESEDLFQIYIRDIYPDIYTYIYDIYPDIHT